MIKRKPLTRGNQKEMGWIIQAVERIRLEAIKGTGTPGGKGEIMEILERAITIPGVELPADCRLLDYDGDILAVGVGMTSGRFREIKASLPADIQEMLIGWRQVATV